MDDPPGPKHPITPDDEFEDGLWLLLDADLNSLSEEYASKSATFPSEKVRQILKYGWVQFLRATSDWRRIPLPMPDFQLTVGDVEKTINCLIVAEKFIFDHQEKWKDKYPDLSDGLAWVTKEVRTQYLAVKESQDLAASLAFAFASKDWIHDRRTNAVKAVMVEGVGNRPRELKNYLICELYDCLKSPFDEGWPEFAGAKNPHLLREHISKLLAPLFPTKILADSRVDPKPRGPIWQAIQNYLK